jgi:uncharacterized SAM-binding protein YcdF (DUF218 family)
MTRFALEKTLALLAMPAGLLWLLLLVLAGGCLRRRQRGPAVLALAATLLVTLAGNVRVADALVGSLERRVPVLDPATLPVLDAVWVLGGGTEQDPAGRPQLNLAGDRVFLAARLWQAGKARLLVASGMARDGITGFRDGGRETRDLWRAVGVPEPAILVVPEPCWNTRDEIRACARLQAARGWGRVGLVSSASHLPRALALARRAGLDLVPLAADRLDRPRPFQIQDLVPQGRAFEVTQRACWEYLGRWTGR